MTAGRWAFLADWPVKLTALVLAIILWAVVQAREPTTQLVDVALVVEPPLGYRLAEQPPRVRALYAGSARELLKLLDAPPGITKIMPDSAPGSTVTLELGPGDLVLLTDADVVAQDVQPRRLHLKLTSATATDTGAAR
ncbi:MAG: hypothetical protein A2W29_12020 [Gemmatimonadetes bacterium RBG_16_66_8]|nr:MAG: hypothetical protein A2W29_12020 [Gemmatimonadetes bacterium RBG_16_66_8]